jgi:hypothetical protein
MSLGTGVGRLFDLDAIVIPIDLDSSQTGEQINLANCGGVDIVFITGDGAAGRDLTFTLKRHVDMADTTGTTFPSTAFSSAPYYYKRHDSTVVGVGTWTKSTFTDTDGATIVLDDTEGEDSRMIVVPVEASQLGDGYSSISIADVVAGGSGAKLGACIAVRRDLQVSRAPQNLATQLA